VTTGDRRPPRPDAAGRHDDVAESGGADSIEDVFSAVEASVGLVEVDVGGGSAWQGPNVVLPGYRRLFGGQLLAQAIAAATVSGGAAGKVARSLHLVFIAEGRTDSPVSWSVEAVHDGRTFATRAVVARQGERVIATGVVSLHAPDTGDHALEHSIAPFAVPMAAEVAAAAQLGAMAFETRPVLSPAVFSRGVGSEPRPFWVGERDVFGPNHHPERPMEPAVAAEVTSGALDGLAVGPPELAAWMRAPRSPRRGTDQLVHQELLAYASDLTMMVAAMRPHEGIGFGSPLVQASAVTSHTISFHRPLRVDEWLLFAQESPTAAGGRAYIRGDWFDDTGRVVASCAQEVLIRVAGPDG